MWISIREKENKNTFVYGGPLMRFIYRFSCDKKVIKAELKISALGIFRVEINAREIDEYFMPGYTNYNKYVLLCSYDITKDVQEENRIAVTVGDGWFAGRLGYTSERAIFGDRTRLYASIRLIYEDGTEEMIETDETWRAYQSEIQYADFFNGECIDENKRIDDWAEYENFENAEIVTENRNFKAYDMEPVVCVDKLTPKQKKRENSILLDFEQNFAGVINFSVKGRKGLKINIRHAEMLSMDGELYMDNLRSARSTDTLILSGKPCKFAPKFTYHGFRYAEITIENGDLNEVEITDICGLVLSQNLKRMGYFECSDEIVNKIYENAYWGQLGNFISVPTDCPQRDERLGWTGDAHVFCDSAMYNADCNRFYRNYMDIVRADCCENGAVPSFVPMFCGVNQETCGSPCWGDAMAIIPYMHYCFYGDKRIIEENLMHAKKWIEFYRAHLNQQNLVEGLLTYGDWLSVKEETDKAVMMQCFYGYSLLLVSEMCEIIGENASVYKGLHDEAKRAFRKYLMNAEGRVISDTQTAYLVAYVAKYMDGEEIKGYLRRAIQRQGDTLTTGFIGVRFLLPVLSEIGESELAYKLIKNTEYPSWGYSVVNGATTIWERWNGYTKEKGFFNPSMNSFNHYSLGSCVYWLYAYVLGIQPQAGEKIKIAPEFSGQLKYAKGSYAFKKGRIFVSWYYRDTEIVLEVGKIGDFELEFSFGDRQILSQEGADGKFVIRLSAI